MHPSSSNVGQLALVASAPADATSGLVGFRYEADWLGVDDEASIIALLTTLPFAPARYKDHLARRRVVSYGGRYDFDAHRLHDATPIIDELLPLRDRAARWADLEPASIAHALVAEYPPGAPLGWHRDVPDFEVVVGISLGHSARLRFRPYPPMPPPRRRAEVRQLVVAPRSIYVLRGPSRWQWQHSVAPVDALRWSITFRTRRTASTPPGNTP